jgi:hypothetical protein
MRKTALALIGLALGLGLATAQAQSDPAAGAAAPQAQAGVPTRGLTMAQGERGFGAPANRLNAIGQPPITRWVYPSFVVYFEHNIVIHAVAASAAVPAS